MSFNCSSTIPSLVSLFSFDYRSEITPAVCRSFLSRGAHIDEVDTNGNTSLMKAITRSLYGVALFLIENGANLNIVNYNGDTAIAFAVVMRSEEMIKAILKASDDHYLAGLEKALEFANKAASNIKLQSCPIVELLKQKVN